ncbi:MAG: pyridoxal phosphate-dependent aminotransferase [Bacteroidota bacterium]|nr:pyridoxal phosphate-dependent aminotransferase [Bacteroidota bacterium]
MIADRISRIGASPTLKVDATAKAMREEGIDVVNLSVGEPDFPTPLNISEAGKKAIDEQFTKYTAAEGILPLRQAIAAALKEQDGLIYEPSEIIVSNGAKHSLYNAVMALVNDGDEVVIPAPYWVSYPEMVKLAGGIPVFIRTTESGGFRMTPEQLRDAIGPRTRAVFLNNPSNPTGCGYSKKDLEALAEIVAGKNLYVLSDEIYGKLMYDGFPFTRFASLGPEIKARTITVDGVSKAYAMTGWRIGWAAGPREVVSAMAKVQSHATSNPSSISQRAALEAYRGPQDEIAKMVAEFRKRRDYVVHALREIPGVSCIMPTGAFYAFPNVSSYYDKDYQGKPLGDSTGLAYYLLCEAHVAVVPGGAFGADEYIRISYATSMDNLEKGIARIRESLARL